MHTSHTTSRKSERTTSQSQLHRIPTHSGLQFSLSIFFSWCKYSNFTQGPSFSFDLSIKTFLSQQNTRLSKNPHSKISLLIHTSTKGAVNLAIICRFKNLKKFQASVTTCIEKSLFFADAKSFGSSWQSWKLHQLYFGKAKHQLTPTITLAESYFEALGSSRRRTKKRYPETRIPDDIFEEIRERSNADTRPTLSWHKSFFLRIFTKMPKEKVETAATKCQEEIDRQNDISNKLEKIRKTVNDPDVKARYQHDFEKCRHEYNLKKAKGSQEEKSLAGKKRYPETKVPDDIFEELMERANAGIEPTADWNKSFFLRCLPDFPKEIVEKAATMCHQDMVRRNTEEDQKLLKMTHHEVSSIKRQIHFRACYDSSHKTSRVSAFQKYRRSYDCRCMQSGGHSVRVKVCDNLFGCKKVRLLLDHINLHIDNPYISSATIARLSKDGKNILRTLLYTDQSSAKANQLNP